MTVTAGVSSNSDRFEVARTSVWIVAAMLIACGFNTGCNQSRYQPAKPRDVPPEFGAAKAATELTTMPDPARFGKITPWIDPNLASGGNVRSQPWSSDPRYQNNSTMPSREGNLGTTLPGRTGTTLPWQAGTTLPGRGNIDGNTLPTRGATTLPMRDARVSDNQPGTTLPQRSNSGN